MKQAWKYYITFFQKKWIILWACVLASVVQSGTLVGITWLVKKIFDEAIPQKNISYLISISLFIILLYATNGIMALSVRYYILKVSQKVSFQLRNQLVKKLLGLEKHSFQQLQKGSVHTTIVQDTERVDTMTNALIAQLLPSLVISLAICMGLLYINFLFFMMTITIIPLIVLLSKWLGKRVQKSAKKMHQSFEDLSAGVQDMVQEWDLIYTQVKSKTTYEKQKNIHQQYSQLRLVGAWLQTAFIVMQDSLLAVGGIVMIVLGGYFVIYKGMTWGELFSFYVALALLKTYVYRIATNIPQVIEGAEALQKIFQFEQIPDRKYKGKQVITFNGNVSLEKVSFGFGEKPLLKDIDFAVEAGKITVLQGENGVGKSTLIQLILGLYYPQNGIIKAESQPYDVIDLLNMLSQIGVVSQKPLLTKGSIYENIGGDKKSRQEACNMALATSFIEQLPQQFDTMIQGNESLSGGQIQRIAIARALIHHPKLLILDEPFNHLDLSTAYSLLNNLLSLPYKPAILIISHQQWVAQKAHTVWQLANGKCQKLPSDSFLTL